MISMNEIDDLSSNFFEERAEYLTDDQLSRWTAPTPRDGHIIRQLSNRGPKLLIGPRGCGKTTFLKMAERQLHKTQSALPVYVNYGRSMFIEPAFQQRSDADSFFQDWLAAKLLVATERALLESDHANPEIRAVAERAKTFIDEAEVSPEVDRGEFPGPSALSVQLEAWARNAGFGRIVLLLDDAAHAFVPTQQRIFFEFIRNIRSSFVTFKAAIYPGVTEYSPSFHVGHDAQLVEVWASVEGAQYFDFIRDIYDRRIPESSKSIVPDGVVELFGATSFGIPRTFLSMIEMYIDSVSESAGGQSTTRARRIISEKSNQLLALHRSLAVKLPRYGMYVKAGETVLDNIISEISNLNEERYSQGQRAPAIEIAIRRPFAPTLDTVIGLLEYAGILRRPDESVSLGAEGVYAKFGVHGALLESRSAIKFGRNPTLQQRAIALVRTSRTGSYKRVGSNTVFPDEVARTCKLIVSNCQVCGAARISDEARFCHNCGSELVEASRLRELLTTPINELQLTESKIKALSENGFDQVEDILRDRGLAEIRKVKSIGPVWARRIFNAAEEYIGV